MINDEFGSSHVSKTKEAYKRIDFCYHGRDKDCNAGRVQVYTKSAFQKCTEYEEKETVFHPMWMWTLKVAISILINIYNIVNKN